MKKMLIICLLLIIILSGLTSLKYIYETKHRKSLDLDYNESTNTIWNPERGWYLIHRFMVNNDSELGKSFYNIFEDRYNSGDSLVLLMFNLKEYNNGEISKEGLQYIDNLLQSVKQIGLKAIVRFVYDWDGNGIESEPNDINIILNHMEQLKSLINVHKDEIYLVQGIFVGSYGEMHSSKYLSEENIHILMNKLLECTPENIKLSVRTPAYWRLISQSQEPINDLTQLAESRIGLYNDGLCSSDSDLGTYSDGTDLNTKYYSKWLREDELKFQSQLCQFVPNGGELAIKSEYNDLDNIVKEFPMLHISYLNRDYNMNVLKKWKMSTYQALNENDPYNGVDGYKYIQDHLGYRFVLRDVSISRRIFTNRPSKVELIIENTGFSNMYYSKNVTLILKGIKSSDIVYVPVVTDIRFWISGELTKLNIPLPTNELKEDTYMMSLKISDNKGNGIQMANKDIYDDQNNSNIVGEIQLENLSLKNIWKYNIFLT